MVQPDAKTPAPTPHFVVGDPVWALKPWPVTLELGTLALHIPARPAADWLAALMAPDSLFGALAQLLDAESESRLQDALVAGALDLDVFEESFLDMVSTVTARRWFVSLRLIEMARQSWDIVGAELTFRGVDAAMVSLAAWLDVAFMIMYRAIRPESLTMWMLKLELPPVGHEEPADEVETSRDQFLGMMD